MPSRHSGNLPQVLPLAKQNRVSTFSDRCVCTSAFLCGKSSSDDFSPRLLLHKQKRSQPLRSKPHIMRRNRLLTISGWGCYNTILMCRQGTAAICRKFCLWQNKIVFQRSQPLRSKPHIMRRNRLLTISGWGCYCVSKNVLGQVRMHLRIFMR